MKKLLFLIPCLCSLVVFYSCQKEVSFEAGRNRSSGSLQSEATGDCLPKTAVGIYERGVALVDSLNFLQVQVDVRTTGSYTIYSDTLNGISFRSTGVFTATGLQSVKVKGNGTPATDGITNFTIVYDSTACTVPVSILASGAAGPATFTLASGTGGACMNATVNGAYVAGIATNASNTVAIAVNVTAVGTYSITTPVSNGISFSGSGSLAAIGAQTITLTASGTPVVAGPTTVPVTAGASTCSFPITVLATAPPAPAGDYFPLVEGYSWSYDYDGNFNDSLFRIIKGTKTIGQNIYSLRFETDGSSSTLDSSGYFRKAALGGNYIQFLDLSDLIVLPESVWAENVFLKDDQPENATWDSQEFTFSGVTAFIRYKITKKNTTMTVKGKLYTNVITVTASPFVKILGIPQDVSAQTGFFTESFAKGYGTIRFQVTNNSDPSGSFYMELRRTNFAP